MATVEIQAARPTDASRLTEIAHAAKRHWGYADGLIALWADDLTVTSEFIVAHPVYCATAASEPIGFYALSSDGPVFELEHMWVDPPWIGSGVGRALLAHAIDVVRARGGSVLRIASDPNAEGFYVAMGATRVGVVDSVPEGRQLPLLELVVESVRASST